MSLTIITGPVGSGKTLRLLSEMKPFSKAAIFTKRTTFPSLNVPVFRNFNKELMNEYDVIGIISGHLYPDELLLDIVTHLTIKSKTVFLTHIISDYKLEVSPNLSSFYVMTDHIIKLKAVCTICGEKALHTYKKTDDYEPRCDICWDYKV